LLQSFSPSHLDISLEEAFHTLYQAALCCPLLFSRKTLDLISPEFAATTLQMLVTRQLDTEQSNWSYSKFETPYHKPPTSPPRMSNHFDPPLSTQPEWQGQYSYLPPADSSIFSQQFDQGNDSSDAAQPRSAAGANSQLDINIKDEPQHSSPLGHRRSVDPLGLRSNKAASPISEQPEAQGGEAYAAKAAESVQDESLGSTDTPGLSLTSNPLSSVSSAGQATDIPPSHAGNEDVSANKDDDDEVVDDEDMIEGDEPSSQPQTAAERTAQRRKMKRFR
jgi:hypothetical protein